MLIRAFGYVYINTNNYINDIPYKIIQNEKMNDILKDKYTLLGCKY